MQRFRSPLSPDDLAAIAERLRAGGIAIVPTDTVYGIAALPSRADALARIVEAKGRDPRKPCQLLASSAEAAFAATGRPSSKYIGSTVASADAGASDGEVYD